MCVLVVKVEILRPGRTGLRMTNRDRSEHCDRGGASGSKEENKEQYNAESKETPFQTADQHAPGARSLVDARVWEVSSLP